MGKNGKEILAVIAFLLLLLALNPSFFGTTAGAIGLQDFENIWTGIPQIMQMGIILIIFILIIAVIIGKD